MIGFDNIVSLGFGGGRYSPEEKWQPADDERAHDYAQRPSCLVLAFHLDDVSVVSGRCRMVVVRGQRGPRRRTAVRRSVGPQLVLGHLPVVVDLVATTNPRVNLFLLPVGFFEYRVVREQHDRARYPKRYGR